MKTYYSLAILGGGGGYEFLTRDGFATDHPVEFETKEQAEEYLSSIFDGDEFFSIVKVTIEEV